MFRESGYVGLKGTAAPCSFKGSGVRSFRAILRVQHSVRTTQTSATRTATRWPTWCLLLVLLIVFVVVIVVAVLFANFGPFLLIALFALLLFKVRFKQMLNPSQGQKMNELITRINAHVEEQRKTDRL